MAESAQMPEQIEEARQFIEAWFFHHCHNDAIVGLSRIHNF
ncbi:MAG: hypothetical protein QGF47_12565 [Arenicellales bacterium]|jgi:cAMP phosphodiesterase|nr:hypothetical protein [Arenicellales bacterium]HJP45710.1 hypothetical protein [Arenicellales bacterium]